MRNLVCSRGTPIDAVAGLCSAPALTPVQQRGSAQNHSPYRFASINQQGDTRGESTTRQIRTRLRFRLLSGNKNPTPDAVLAPTAASRDTQVPLRRSARGYDAAMPLPNGATFAGFTVMRLLGSGGTGDVYVAEQPRTRQQVALKILHADVSADRDFRDRFEPEVDLAARLEHPNIARALDRGEFEGRLWLASEYISGLDTGRSVRERYPAGMPRRAVYIIVDRIAHALDFVHQHGLLHRHVKPGNILLEDPDSDTYRILLTDFGTARRLDTLRELSTATGPDDLLAYAAPEELSGNNVNGRADQYGLAATAFELLTGIQRGRARQNPPSRLADTHADLADLDPIIASALAVDPTARFASCTEFATALVEAGERVPAVSAQPGLPAI
ncbi:MAG: serine/threonine protein kinase, bacterial [Mycobacterium sp.]|nr:serine/threonine protein kinase, bacterial [Mycobacterium sp.]